MLILTASPLVAGQPRKCDSINACASTDPGAQVVFRGQRDFPAAVQLADRIAAERRMAWNEDAAREEFRANAVAGTPAPAYRLAFPLSGTGMTEAVGSAMDGSGNIYLAGGFGGTVTFPTNPATTVTATGDIDMFLAKFSPTGQCLWARVGHGPTGLLPGLSLGAALSVIVDGAGNVYAGGGFVRSLTFYNGSTVAGSVTGTGPGYNFESFLAKYDANGNLLWANGGGSDAGQDPADLDTGTNGITNLAVDSQGNLFAGGSFNGDALLGYDVSLPNVDAAFVAQINPATGVPYWVNVTDSDGFDGIQDIASDSSGGVYALLWSEGSTMDFPTAGSPTTINFDSNSVDGFLARYSGGGTCLWARQPGGVTQGGFIVAQGLSASPQSEAYVTGESTGDAVFDSLPMPAISADGVEMFLTKYTPGGAAAWVRDFVSTGYSYGQRVTVDGAGFAYVVGGYLGATSMTGNSNTPGITLVSGVDDDLFLAQWDYLGTPRWIRPLSSPGRANAGYRGGTTVPVNIDSARLAYDAAGKNILVTGDFAQTMVLDTNVSVSAGSSAQASYAALLPSGDATVTNGDPALRFQVNSQGWSGDNYFVDIAVVDAGAGRADNATITSARAVGLTGAAIASPAIPAVLGNIPPTGTRVQRLYVSGLNPAVGSHFTLGVNGNSMRDSDGKLFNASFATLITAAPRGF
jgi:hypothetical protein